jgi:hypothetical protein
LGGVLPHPLKTGAVLLCAGFLIGIFGGDLPTLRFAEVLKLAALVIDFLPFALPGGFIVAFVGAR